MFLFKKGCTIVFIGTFFLMFCCAGCGISSELPGQRGYVNDFAGVISGKLLSELALFMPEIEKKSGVEFVVVTMKRVEDTLPESADTIFTKWQIGAKEPEQKGILLLVDTKSKKAIIKNSSSLNDILTSDRKKVVIDVLMKPSLEKNNFNDAVASGVLNIAKILRDFLGADIQPVYLKARKG